jgi:hypothetical protein
MVDLGDVEPTNAVAFAISELVSLDVVRVSFGDGHGIFLGQPVFALVVHIVAWRVLYLVHYLFVCHHNFFLLCGVSLTASSSIAGYSPLSTVLFAFFSCSHSKGISSPSNGSGVPQEFLLQ